MPTQPMFRLVGVLLLGMTSLITLGTPLYALPAHHQVKPAGCHGHSAPARDRAPVSYQCCAVGHNVAIPGSGFTILPLAVVGGTAVIEPVLLTAWVPAGIFTLHLCVDGSPGFDPLRI